MGIMTNQIEQTVPWVWKIWYDMDLDGMQEFVAKNQNKSKIDQVIDFYGIPYIYKNEYRRFLKHRIQERHRPVVQDHFDSVLAMEWYDEEYRKRWSYGELQTEYNRNNPDPEQMWLKAEVDYNKFKEKELESQEAKGMEWYMTKKEWENMMVMMSQMMQEMNNLTKTIGHLSPNTDSKDDWNKQTNNQSNDWESTEDVWWPTSQNKGKVGSFASEMLGANSDSWWDQWTDWINKQEKDSNNIWNEDVSWWAAPIKIPENLREQIQWDEWWELWATGDKWQW